LIGHRLVIGRESELADEFLRDHLRDELEQRIVEAIGTRPDPHVTKPHPDSSRSLRIGLPLDPR